MRRLFALLVLLAPCAWGQTVAMKAVTSSSNTFRVSDHLQSCTFSTVNCWSSKAGPGNVQVYETPKGGAIGVDSSGCARLYSDPLVKGNNTWSPSPWGCGLSYVWYGSNGSVYALTGACGTGKYVSRHDSAGWKHLSTHCFKALSVDKNASEVFALVDTAGEAWVSNNYATTLAHIPGCGTNGGALAITVLRSDLLGIVCKDNSIWYGTATGSKWDSLGGKAVSIDGSGTTIYVADINGAVDVRRLGVDTNWMKINSGGVTQVAYNPTLQSVWAISGGISYRMTEWGIFALHTYNATTVCYGGQCPNQGSNPPVYHVATTHAVAKTNGVVTSNGNVGNSGHVDPIAATAVNSYVAFDDPVDCFIDPNNCTINIDQEAYVCNESGTLDNGFPGGGAPSYDYEYAFTRDWAIGKPSCGLTIDLVYVCAYPVGMYCLNTPPPPIFDPLSIHASNSGDFAFDTHASCWSFDGRVTWSCIGGAQGGVGTADVEYHPPEVDPGPAVCTNR